MVTHRRLVAPAVVDWSRRHRRTHRILSSATLSAMWPTAEISRRAVAVTELPSSHPVRLLTLRCHVGLGRDSGGVCISLNSPQRGLNMRSIHTVVPFSGGQVRWSASALSFRLRPTSADKLVAIHASRPFSAVAVLWRTGGPTR